MPHYWRQNLRNLLLALAVTALIGCGDDAKKATSSNVVSNNTSIPNTGNTPRDNGSVPQFELGNDSAKVSTLDAATICEKGTAYFNSALTDIQAQKIECSTTAYFVDDNSVETDAELQAACQTTYDECMAMPFDQPVITSEGCIVTTQGCDATVGLFEACIEGQVARNVSVIERLDCSKVTLDGNALVYDEQPASCTQLTTECPELLGN